MSIRPARWQPERDFPAIAEAFNLVVEETADGERLAAEHAAPMPGRIESRAVVGGPARAEGRMSVGHSISGESPALGAWPAR